ncbi:MAG: hypothetical protein COV32_00385 [Candidatus Yonathbacteria bacterium CG10_big_fil_rev_8_21_14_0_10_43_136]|uniref:Bacterial repeat domain-containing protein n=1 Tax=Candidatus Yonathbacteria bacterium CG_4_10_14_0_8_um_filter_43_17 TaxID=1975099 RepID=A0A2M7Q4N3_9BACT|nr:MAG: hypothetical protein COW60_01550 [Candidatus Yonathbacteria bacterium CG17_big_fil_post_rev_8_21_14_2_50_43_9]PIR40988.1 MAG: hypothetical protein COV32_00385 [Candidatus Yonathbacteria bacterium CG10_big_fil_rev_8_21_14_0_10_43_136]PIX57339.1 MAG: hypothetical protein COZ48_01180 [Candidatus Yonathbacteria bacterium CG_4_10_14_3_um_filter_43_12]PIY58396.1 MAG: hypothetical protein COY98_02330 [Candidatus Yonathbacteria bacterium CG_4_10_14_0_8_um_filter_43_17]PJC21873.1 MAG: hypothetic
MFTFLKKPTWKIVAMFSIAVVFLFSISTAFALTTAQVYPTLGTSVSESPWSNNGWATPTNIYSDDSATANVTPASYDTGDRTYVLKATGFDFSAIPDGSTINGVTARVNAFYRSGQGSGSIDLCQLLDVSRAKVGTNQCSTAVALTTNTGTIITKGSSADTWGNTLTTAWVKDPDFGIAIGVLATAYNADVDVDYVTLEIDYTLPDTAPTLSISQPDGSGDIVNVGDLYNITYSLADAEQTVTASFYYDTNNSGLDGTAITGACASAGEGTNATCSWNTTGVTPGTYYVYGLTTDGIAPQVSSYSYGTITINAPVVTFDIIATVGGNGATTPSGVTNVPQGGSQTYSITPNSGYDVETLLIDGSSIATSTSYTFTNVQASHTIYATFALLPTPPVTHTITSSAGSNGSITPLGAIVVADSASQTFTIAPDSGFTVATLVVDSVGVATSTSYTFTNVTVDHTIAVTFALIPAPHGSFTIIANQNPNGIVSPSGSTVVAEGGSQTYTITPNSSYDVASLIIDSSPLSSTSTSYTFTNVTADHTIEAIFVALPGTEPAPIAIVRRLASITFSGRAFPDGKISIVRKELGNEIVTKEQGVTDANGFFNIRFTDLQTGSHSFGVLIKDPDGRASQTKFFVVDVSRGDEIFKDIIAPPTVDILNGQVSRGGNLKIFGYASPSHTIRVYFDDILVKEALAGRGGVYSFDMPTGALDFGQHRVRAKQINLDGGRESDYSTERAFIVSKLTVVKADFSGDGKIDITDWSIFLARWSSKNSLVRAGIDLNDDGKVDISDFSIFIKTIRKK